MDFLNTQGNTLNLSRIGSKRKVMNGNDGKWTLVMGPGQFFVARVESAIYGLGLNLENFP